jgi:NitT/TauT family transport system permease protein
LWRARWAFSQAWPRVLLIGFIVAVWAGVSATGYWSRAVLPPPASTWDALKELVAEGTIVHAAAKSLLRLFGGFGVSIVVGTVIGIAMAASSLVQRSLGSLMAGLQSVPSVAWLPLAILWFGLSIKAILFVVVIGSLPAVALATAASLRQVPPLLERAGRTLGARGWRLWRSVVFPTAIPGYTAGLQQAWALAWRSLMAGELIATGSIGLGQMLFEAQQRFDAAEVLAVMAVIVVIGISADLLVFGTLDRRIRSRRGLLVAR